MTLKKELWNIRFKSEEGAYYHTVKHEHYDHITKGISLTNLILGGVGGIDLFLGLTYLPFILFLVFIINLVATIYNFQSSAKKHYLASANYSGALTQADLIRKPNRQLLTSLNNQLNSCGFDIVYRKSLFLENKAFNFVCNKHRVSKDNWLYIPPLYKYFRINLYRWDTFPFNKTIKDKQRCFDWSIFISLLVLFSWLIFTNWELVERLFDVIKFHP